MVDPGDWYLNVVAENERQRQLLAAEMTYQSQVALGTSPATAFATKLTSVAAAHAVITTVQAKVATRTTAGFNKGK